jgi:hypothetical protein
MYNNQLDALFILGLLNYHTSTSMGIISSPSSGGRMYICGRWYLCYTSELTLSGPARPADSQLYLRNTILQITYTTRNIIGKLRVLSKVHQNKLKKNWRIPTDMPRL